MRFRVTYLDGSDAEVVATASARRSYEETHQQPILAAVASGMSSWADEIAHHSLRQREQTGLDFDEWIDTVETVTYGMPEGDFDAMIAELKGVYREGDPTSGAKARSRASSSKRRSSPASQSGS